MDSSRERLADEEATDGPPVPTQSELEMLLDANEADIVAGRTLPLAPVLARMRATAERIRRDRLLANKANRSA